MIADIKSKTERNTLSVILLLNNINITYKIAKNKAPKPRVNPNPEASKKSTR